MTFRARKPSGPDVSGDVGPPVESWTYNPNPPFMRRPFAYSRQRRSSTACSVYPCRWLAMSMVARRRIAIHHFPKAARGVLPFSGWKSKVRYHRIRGRHLRIECCSTISALRSLPRIRPRTRGACCGVSSTLPRASLFLRKRLFGSSSSFQRRIEQGSSLSEAMLAGYKAFFCSSHFLYLREPSDPTTGNLDQYAIASRLSHFLTNTRPDPALMELAATGKLRDADTLRRETDRLINSPGFDRLVGTSPTTGSICATFDATNRIFVCIPSTALMTT